MFSRTINLFWISVTVLVLLSCSREKTEKSMALYASAEQITQDNLENDRIPDFSRVGYHYGDKEIPTPAVVERISLQSVHEALSDGTYQDTTSFIQGVIDRVGRNGGGAILLKNGIYNVSRTLFLDWDNTVLRGESRTGTVIHNTSKSKMSIVYLGRSQGREAEFNSNGILVPSSPTRTAASPGSQIAEDYVPVGRDYLRVENPSLFSEGETVLIYRPRTKDWISDIGMDKIPPNINQPEWTVVQWDQRGSIIFFERSILSIEGDILFLDAPIVMALDRQYGGGTVMKVNPFPRVRESGVENIGFDCSYDETLTKDYGGGKKGGIQYVDEDHAWTAIWVSAADNCWIRDVNSTHMGFSLAYICDFAKRISVLGCSSASPVSLVEGGRRYAFVIGRSELCLIKDCNCDNDRHGCATNGIYVPGPNVFTNCTGSNMRDAMGPHMAWSMGTLFDLIATDGIMAVEDRGFSGNGHGWSGVNTVFWNVSTGNDPVKSYITCQSPWSKENTPSLSFRSNHPSGRNYCIGAIGLRQAYDQPNVLVSDNDDYYNRLGLARPSGTWYPFVAVNDYGIEHVSVFDSNGIRLPWWPLLKTESVSNPMSLYQSQLDDRHARGIFLD